MVRDQDLTLSPSVSKLFHNPQALLHLQALRLIHGLQQHKLLMAPVPLTSSLRGSPYRTVGQRMEWNHSRITQLMEVKEDALLSFTGWVRGVGARLSPGLIRVS